MTPQEAIKWADGKTLEIICELEVTKSKERQKRLNEEYSALTTFKSCAETKIPQKPEPFERTAHDFQSDVCKHSHYPCEYIKPFNHEYKYTDYKCPVCGKLTKDGTPRFCWHCGQALDWSDAK